MSRGLPSTAARLRRWAGGFGVLALLALLLAGNWPILAGKAAPLWDAHSYYAPYFVLVSDFARAGRLLLWNPWSNGGSPDFAEPQFGVFSPLLLGVGLLSGGGLAGFWAYALLSWFLAAVGAFVLSRHLGASVGGAFALAVGTAFAGCFTGHAEHTSVVHAYAAVPWLIWRIDVALQRGELRPAAQAGAIWGLSALAGYPGVVMLAFGFAVLWAIGFALCPGPGSRPPAAPLDVRLRRTVTTVAVALVVGLLILSPAYASFAYETAGYSDRSAPLERAWAIGHNALQPGALVTVASPYLPLLQLSNPGIWGSLDVSSCSVYSGALLLWLPVVALLLAPGDGRRWWLAVVALLGLMVALGPLLPLRGWLYDWVPPTRYFRHASFFRCYLLFAQLALASLAIRDLRQRVLSNSLPRGMLLVSALAVAGLACGLFVHALDGRTLPPGLRLAYVHLAVVWGGVVLCGLLVARTSGTWQFRALVLGVTVVAIADGLLTADLSQPTLFDQDPAHVQYWRTLDATRERSLQLPWRRSYSAEPTPQIDNSNLLPKKPVLVSYAGLQNRYHLGWAASPVLRDAALGRKRVWFSSDFALLPATIESWQAFRTRAEQLGGIPIVLHRAEPDADGRPAAETARSLRTLTAATSVAVELVRYRPDQLKFDVECPAAGWLLVTDRWARGWRAQVNGADSRVWLADFVFRAVRVKAGRNEVDFTYHPRTVPLVLLSWLTLAGVAAWTVTARLREHAASSRAGRPADSRQPA